MNDFVKMANIAKVKANLAAGMPMMAAIKKAYPDYTDDQVKALAAQMGGMSKQAAKKGLAKRIARKLYGKKPGENTVRNIGALLGGIKGADTGAGLALLTQTTKPKKMGVPTGAGIVAGGLTGGALGAKGGKAIDKMRMAKYKARRRKVNAAIAGGGGISLAAVLAGSKKASKKRKKSKA